MAMPIGVARYPCLLAVLLGFVVLLPVLEQAILAYRIVLTDLVRIVTRSFRLTLMLPASILNLCLPDPGLVALLIRRASYRALLHSIILLVLSHHALPRRSITY